MATDIFCGDCGATGSVGRVTASLRCRCGSDNLGLQGVDPQPQVAKESAGGTGWNKPMPSPTRGWNEYAGPLPGRNPNPIEDADNSEVCPNCHGTGWDLAAQELCRRCNGTGRIINIQSGSPTPTMDATVKTGPEVGGARRTPPPSGAQRTSTLNSTPGRTVTMPSSWSEARPQPTRAATRRGDGAGIKVATAAIKLEASCPVCAAKTTMLVPDRTGHAWWSCKCGSLADLDDSPRVDPFNQPRAWLGSGANTTNADRGKRIANRGFKGPRKLARKQRQDGRIFPLLERVTASNTLGTAEALGLARNTLIRYPA